MSEFEELNKNAARLIRESLAGTPIQLLAMAGAVERVLGIDPARDGYELRFAVQRPWSNIPVDHDAIVSNPIVALNDVVKRAKADLVLQLRAAADAIEGK